MFSITWLRRAAAVSALGVLAACGTPAHNDADVRFATEMRVHHTQAIQMADLALQNCSGAVQDIATEIKAAQGPEIDLMDGLLDDWSAQADVDMAGMPGMSSEADLATLSASTGTACDQQFLTLMIAHHEGAITMAQDELDAGVAEEATALAQQIIDGQRPEIDRMQQLLGG